MLFAAANHPEAFASLIVGSGATDVDDVGGILDEIVHAPTMESFANLTGEQFVRGAIGNMTKYSVPEVVLDDYLASYQGARFAESVRYVRDYRTSLPLLATRLADVAVPCQITVGAADPFVPPSNAAGLHRGIRRSKLDILDVGHFVWEDAAAEYGNIARDWIQGGFERV